MSIRLQDKDMKKLLSALVALCAIYGSVGEAFAVKRFTTYTPLTNYYGNYATNYPQTVTRYDANGNRIGTYAINRRYAPQSTYIPTNRVLNRTYYYNNTYNPAMYRYNGGLGGLKTYNRFGRRIR